MNYKYYLLAVPPAVAIGFAFQHYGKSQWLTPFFIGCVFAEYVSFLYRKYKA